MPISNPLKKLEKNSPKNVIHKKGRKRDFSTFLLFIKVFVLYSFCVNFFKVFELSMKFFLLPLLTIENIWAILQLFSNMEELDAKCPQMDQKRINGFYKWVLAKFCILFHFSSLDFLKS
jgi:hypothetical protein